MHKYYTLGSIDPDLLLVCGISWKTVVLGDFSNLSFGVTGALGMYPTWNGTLRAGPDQ